MNAHPIDILLVEDNPGEVRLMEEAMREAGMRHRLSVAPDGLVAMDLLRGLDLSGQARRPDLILLDMSLPGMDGCQVLAAIKGDPALRTIPVAVLTTSSAAADVLAAYDLHANCYITKPLGLDQFVTMLRSLDAFWCGSATLPPR